MAKASSFTRGLSTNAVPALREKYGWNQLPEKQVNLFLLYLSYLWGPMPIMIWVAIVIEFSKAIAVGEGWEDFAVLMVLQFSNATVGFIEERNAGDAIAALKQQLAPACFVCRDGKWASMPARELVPGDVIELKIGDIVPADAILGDGHAVQVDQAALTGESLPVTVSAWGQVLMGSALKRGEIKAVVCNTGQNTFFGKAAGMISSVESQGHLAALLFSITFVLLVMSVLFCSIIFAKLMTTDFLPDFLNIDLPENDMCCPSCAPPLENKFIASLSVVIVILVASIPIAIEVVTTSTLAVGSHMMAKSKVIVARLSAIEELAGMTILCSDKTGTLTLNQLSLREPILLKDGLTAPEMLFLSALASKRTLLNQDAIDLCITQAVPESERARLATYIELSFKPFNPTDKRTEALIRGPDGKEFLVSKGAPQAILKIVHDKDVQQPIVKAAVQELADRGFRPLGVAVSMTGKDEPPHWVYYGILSLFDPPRPDTKATIAAALANGIEVKMVTGDQTAIAKETCRELGMGTNILNTEVLSDPTLDKKLVAKIIMEAHGFAEVLPEHKFQIVQTIREQGHMTGMTGDGVNDAPALKRADIGIAVHGATDAARAAADIVLTEPGLSVIIFAILESRKIFQRMRNYIIYRIACTIQLLCFFFFAVIAIKVDAPKAYDTVYPLTVIDARKLDSEAYPTITDPEYMQHTPEFTLPVIALVIITILNDGCMITISKDYVLAENFPQKWTMCVQSSRQYVIWFASLIVCSPNFVFLPPPQERDLGCFHGARPCRVPVLPDHARVHGASQCAAPRQLLGSRVWLLRA